MQCAVCGHRNPEGAKICSSCGAALGLSATGTPVSGTPGIATGGTSGDGVQGNIYSPHLAKGVRLQNGSYAVGDVLGQGGFGITYKGGDLSLRRYVALKEFFPAGCIRQGATVMPSGSLSAADYAGVKAKFIEEARTLARFNDPGIVRVYGVFEENNTAYMVMEFLEGQTLSKRISEKGMLDETEVVSVAQKVGRALATVHEAGLIHRDIKPDNICLTGDGRAVLIDFGTARAFASGKTVQQTTMLTPGYAPLEQYGQQARFGAYTDIYALAATLYQAVTGQVPPQATDRAAGVELKAPHLLNPKISSGLSRALVWALQVKATERPQTVQQFLNALQTPAQNTPQILSPAVLPGAVELSPVPISTMPRPAGAWGQPTPTSTPSADSALVWQLADNQVLTNASPQDALNALQRAFQGFGVANPTVDSSAYRVLGSSGPGMRSWAQNIVGQITQDERGTYITITSTVSVGVTDYGRGKDETRKLVAALQNELRTLPAAPTATPAFSPPSPYSTPSPYPQARYPSPIALPNSGGYYEPVQPMVRMQGGSILALGMFGLFCCGICAPIAWINGNNALKEYGDRDPGDRGSVVAGRILGIIGTVMWGLYLSGLIINSMGS